MIKVGSIVKLVKSSDLDKYLSGTGQLSAYNKKLKISRCFNLEETEYPYIVRYEDYVLILMKKDVIEIKETNILLQQIYDNEIQNRRSGN